MPIYSDEIEYFIVMGFEMIYGLCVVKRNCRDWGFTKNLFRSLFLTHIRSNVKHSVPGPCDIMLAKRLS